MPGWTERLTPSTARTTFASGAPAKLVLLVEVANLQPGRHPAAALATKLGSCPVVVEMAADVVSPSPNGTGAGGGSSEHSGIACAHRSWNRHPDGGWKRLGMLPGISSREPRVEWVRGTAPPAGRPCPGVRGVREHVTNRPRLHDAAAVHDRHPITELGHDPEAVRDRRTVRSNSRTRPVISARICACVDTSRAVVGSSAIRRSGSPASAIAITTRCRIPPLSS